MTRSTRSLLPALLVVIATIASCDHVAPTCSSIDGRAGTCGLGEACGSSLDCVSSNCSDHTCEASCTRAADCPAHELCVSVQDLPGERRFCSATCPTGTWHVVGDSGGLVCVGGAIQSCTDLTDLGPVCDTCGCQPGDRCLDPEGVACGTATTPCMCLAPQPVGSPCISNVGCFSFNCSGSAGSASRRCEIPAGTPCDATSECVHCDALETGGATVCRQSCERDADCAGGVCVALGDPNELACYVDCTLDGSCPSGEHCTPLVGDPRARLYCAPR